MAMTQGLGASKSASKSAPNPLSLAKMTLRKTLSSKASHG